MRVDGAGSPTAHRQSASSAVSSVRCLARWSSPARINGQSHSVEYADTFASDSVGTYLTPDCYDAATATRTPSLSLVWSAPTCFTFLSPSSPSPPPPPARGSAYELIADTLLAGHDGWSMGVAWQQPVRRGAPDARLVALLAALAAAVPQCPRPGTRR